MPGEENGTIMKKSVENESRSLRGLNEDVAVRNFVPEFKREVEHNGEGTYTHVWFYLFPEKLSVLLKKTTSMGSLLRISFLWNEAVCAHMSCTL